VRSRRRPELVAVGAPALEDRLHFEPIAVGQRALHAVQLLLIGAQGPQHFVAVLFENGFPELRVAAGDAGRVAQAAAGEVAPAGVALREGGAECRGQHLRQVADVRHYLVVHIRRHAGDLSPERLPESGDFRGGDRIGLLRPRRHEHRAPGEQVGPAVFPTGLLGTGHRMRADETGARAQRGGGEPANLGLDAADVRDDRARSQRRRDFLHEGHDAVDRRADDDERGGAHGFAGGVSHRVEPSLASQREADFRPAGPDGDVLRRAEMPRRPGDGGTEQTGGEDGEPDGHEATKTPRHRMSSPGPCKRIAMTRNPRCTMSIPMNFDKLPEHRRSATVARARRVRWIVFGVLVIAAATAAYFHREARKTELREQQRATIAALQEQRVAAAAAVAEANQSELPLAERIARTERLLIIQRHIAQESGRAITSYVEDLQRTEAELDRLRVQEKVQLSLARESAAVAAGNAGDNTAAAELWREAWQLQRDVNRTGGGVRNIEREQRLEQEVARLAAEPIQKVLQEKLTAAQRAVTDKQWDAALGLYREARELQERLNREFPRSRYSDLAALSRIDAEIASLSADGLDVAINAKLAEARQLALSGRQSEAAAGLAEAADAQRTLNERFGRSRFVSMERLEEIESERQTTLAADALKIAVTLRDQAEQHLRRREVFQAQQSIREALAQLEEIAARLPKAKGVDEAMRMQLAFLNVRSDDLANLQDRLYEQLAPLPGQTGIALLKAEVLQAEFTRLMSSNPSRNPGRTQPVDSVTLAEATEFCRRAGWVLGWKVRLPTLEEVRLAGSEGAGVFQNLKGGLAEWLASEAEGSNGPVLNAEGVVEQAARSERSRARGFRVAVEVDLVNPASAR